MVFLIWTCSVNHLSEPKFYDSAGTVRDVLNGHVEYSAVTTLNAERRWPLTLMGIVLTLLVL